MAKKNPTAKTLTQSHTNTVRCKRENQFFFLVYLRWKTKGKKHADGKFYLDGESRCRNFSFIFIKFSLYLYKYVLVFPSYDKTFFMLPVCYIMLLPWWIKGRIRIKFLEGASNIIVFPQYIFRDMNFFFVFYSYLLGVVFFFQKREKRAPSAIREHNYDAVL